MSNDKRLEVLVQDGYFPTEAPQAYVINSEKELTSLYSKINRTRKPGLPIPNIDFSTHVVLVACLGEVNTTSLPTMFISDEKSDKIAVSVKKGDEGSNTGIQAYPFCIYSLVNENKEVVLEMP